MEVKRLEAGGQCKQNSASFHLPMKCFFLSFQQAVSIITLQKISHSLSENVEKSLSINFDDSFMSIATTASSNRLGNKVLIERTSYTLLCPNFYRKLPVSYDYLFEVDSPGR